MWNNIIIYVKNFIFCIFYISFILQRNLTNYILFCPYWFWQLHNAALIFRTSFLLQERLLWSWFSTVSFLNCSLLWLFWGNISEWFLITFSPVLNSELSFYLGCHPRLKSPICHSLTCDWLKDKFMPFPMVLVWRIWTWITDLIFCNIPYQLCHPALPNTFRFWKYFGFSK